MFYPHMDPFPNNSVPNLFVDFNAHGALGDVPDLAGAAMIELVGHTLVNGAVHLDIHIIPNLVGSEGTFGLFSLVL